MYQMYSPTARRSICRLGLVVLAWVAGVAPGPASAADPAPSPPAPEPRGGALVAGTNVDVLCTIAQDERLGRVRVLNGSSISDDGRRLLLRLDQPAASRDMLGVYDTRTGKELLRRGATRPATIALIGDALAPDGSLVAYHEMNARVQTDVVVADVASGGEVWRARRRASVTAAFLGGEVRILLSEAGGRRGSRVLTLLDPRTGRTVKQTQTDRVGVTIAPASADGSLLVATRTLNDGPDPTCVYRLDADEVVCVLADCIAPYPIPDFIEGRNEVVGLEKGSLVKWDARTGRRTARVDVFGGREPAGPVALSPDGRLLFATLDNAVHVIDTIAESRVAEIRSTAAIEVLAAANDGTFIIQRPDDSAVQVAKLKSRAR